MGQTSHSDHAMLLRKQGLKATSGRLKLIAEMNDFTGAISYSKIQELFEKEDRVTLYRTIETLVKHGIIHEAYRENNEKFYALCGSSCLSGTHHHDHVHFKCDVCHTVTCENVRSEVNITLPGYDIRNLTIQATGVCKKCA